MSTTVPSTSANPVPDAHQVRRDNLALAARSSSPFVSIHGNTIPIRRVLWVFGGRFDRAACAWYVPQHKAQEAQALADRFAKPTSREQPATTPRSPILDAHAGESIPGRATASGVSTLGDAELMALLATARPNPAAVAKAQHGLDQGDGLLGLAAVDALEIAQKSGFTVVQAVRIAAGCELARRLSRARRRQRPSLRTPEEVAAIGLELAILPHEELWCLPLDPHSRLIGEPRQISRGDIDGTDAGPRAFFRNALAAGASSCIAVHNHPSGDLAISAADLAATRRLVAAGRTLDLALVDHVILGDGGRFVSLRRERASAFT